MRYLVTGGAGFIGANCVDRLLGRGDQAVILDDLSRPGVQANLDWLAARHGPLTQVLGRVQDPGCVAAALAEHASDVIVHLAGQTAVTTSVADPRSDFDANARGTLEVLEAARSAKAPPIVLYASTNKVYGPLPHLEVVEEETRWAFRDRPQGVGEDEALDLYSPYGCSKGAGDQYARDYARIYGLRTVVFRQSCIYGPRQLGLEDQGWIAWFLIAAREGLPIRVFGDGKQVRDVLHVRDLLDAYDAAVERIDVAAGRVYNVGGGPQRSMSVWVEFAPLLETLLGHPVKSEGLPWRPGDQRVFVSNVDRAQRELDWMPRIGVEEGVAELADWVRGPDGPAAPA